MHEHPIPILTGSFSEAFAFASAAHATQVRKSTTIPYVSHLLGVASLVLEHGADEPTAIAALLHDAAEDAGGRAMLEEIAARFGKNVADIVDGCTDTLEKNKPAWDERKRAYLERLRTQQRNVCLVVAADKLHNARSILRDFRSEGDAVWKRFTATPDRQAWYYRTVHDVVSGKLTDAQSAPLARELGHVIEAVWGKGR